MEGFGLLDAAVGWVIGLATAFGGLWVYRHTAKRDAFQDHCSSYKERIAMREKELEQAVEEPDKETKRHRLSDLRDEYDQFLEAWQQKQELASLVPPRAITADKPKPSAEEIARLVELLTGSARLPAMLLTANDYLIRGNAYYEAGDYEQALEAYNRVLELMPDRWGTLGNRSATLIKLGRYGDALRDVNRALELRPDDPITLNNRGYALAKAERYEDAFKDINRALELRPNYHLALCSRAEAHSLMGQFEDALRDLEAAIEGNEKYREEAKTAEDFEKLRNDPEYGPRFRELVGE